jgi:hypothetical protein
MNDKSKGPSRGEVLAGAFVIVVGLCITLVGGACTLIWGALLIDGNSWAYGNPVPLIASLVSLVALVGGLLNIVHGVRIALGRRRREAVAQPTGATDDIPQA